MKSLRAAIPALIAATLVLRAPGFVWKILGIDDADFTVIARAMVHGAVPYRDVVDIKPPLTFVLYLPNALLGEALWPVQVEAAIFVVASALALGLAAKRTWGGARAGQMAAALALAAGVCEAPTVSTELLMTLPTALALALHARAESEGATTARGAALAELGAGALLGCAALIRHQAVFTLGALGLATILLGLRGRRPWFARCVALTVGFAVPWALTIAAFQGLGALPDFLDWVILRNVRYVGQSSGSAALRLLQSLAVCIVAAAPLAWWAALVGLRSSLRDTLSRSAPTTDDPEARLRATWALLMVVSWVPVSLGGRFYEHYFLQLVPAVALLGAGPLEALLDRARAWSRGGRAALAVLAFGPPLGAVGYATARGILGQYPLQNPKVQAIGAWAKASTAPDARLFVWGHFSPIYLAANRLPGTRYITTSWQLGNFDPQHLDDSVDLTRFRSDRDVAQTLDDLRRRRPDWVIDTTPADIHAWHRLPLRILPDLERAIDEDFRVVPAAPGGARILERRTTPGSAR